MSGYVQPKAAWKVTLDGRDLTETLAPLLISMRLTEKRGEEADELTIVINDSAGAVAIPPDGAKLHVHLGWERGTGVTVGMVDKGSFIVDEVSWSGPPDQIDIRARSADLKGDFRTRKNKVWHNAPLGTVVKEIAAHHSLTPRCHADLASKVITAEQGNKSDMQFLRDIGRRFDATATVKAASLIFAPIGADTTATGKAIPTFTIDRRNTSSVSWKRAARDNAQDGAEAQWHDGKAAARQTTGSGGAKRKRLKKVYSSESDAKAATTAETARLKRAAASLDLDLSLGDPSLAPNMKGTTTGFKPEVDKYKWLIATAEHAMDATGLSTKLTLEVAD